MMNRRHFSQALSAAMLGQRAFAARKLTLHIGHTVSPGFLSAGRWGRLRPSTRWWIRSTWRPPSATSPAWVSTEWSYSAINWRPWKRTAGSARCSEKHKLPLISAYCGTNLSDPAQRKTSIAKTLEWAELVKKYNGKVIVVGPNGVQRDTYDFKAHKDDILATLNELGKAVTDMGLTAVLHQHTGTCVESREETYAVMEAVDTKVMKFGPDIGQLQKGGSDPVQVVKDFLPLVQHMHLKDYSGGQEYLGYCPLGQGKVNIPAILSMMEGRQTAGLVMVELDSPPPQPAPALENAKIAKAYLEKQGVSFRS